MKSPTVYLHPKCSTCSAARAWLQENGVDFTEKDIRATPPTVGELKAMLAALGGRRSKLFNTSGVEYRGQGLAARLPGMSDPEAFSLLAGNGMLVKRPFLIAPGVGLVGFKPEAWAAAFPRA